MVCNWKMSTKMSSQSSSVGVGGLPAPLHDLVTVVLIV